MKLILTNDGSHTLYVPELKEHYHSVFGAMQESRHIFLNAGFYKAIESKRKLNVLEAGFGTGLNALLTCLAAEKEKARVNYTAVELHPLPPAIYHKLNYAALVKEQGSLQMFLKLHSSDWGDEIRISDHFTLKKLKTDIREIDFPDKRFDLIYFDAFAPEVQPELWTADVFKRYALCSNKNCVLVTYSCKGEVKRNLKSAGFVVEKLPGPPGKREILRAVYQTLT